MLVVVLSISGCPTPQTPADVARRYLEAVAANRADDAWQLLSVQERRRITQQEFQRRVAALTDRERRRIEAQAAQLSSERLTAQWRSSEGDLVLEHRGKDTWIVTGPLPRFDRQDTPRQALLTFARAFRNQDYETLLKLAPTGERTELTPAKLAAAMEEPEFRRSVESTLAALTEAGPGEESGSDRWTFRKGRHRADLKLEDGRWRVVDVR